MTKTFAITTLLLGAFAATTVSAETLSDQAAQVFNARATSMISAAAGDAADTEGYIDGLKSTCNGLVGDLMSAHVPNAAGIQLQSFCTGVNDLERAYKANKTGRNAYCGDFDQGINAAHKMKADGDMAAIYETAQSLAAAAETIKATHFATKKNVGWGLGAGVKNQSMSCS